MCIKEFKNALAFVMMHEGTYSDHPLDAGGPTNYGISTAFLRAHGINKKAHEITYDEAKKLYELYFWNPFRMNRFKDEGIQTFLFDSAVNCGVGRATEFLQTAVNYLSPIEIDGIIGNKTVGATNDLCESIDRKFLIDLLIITRAIHYLNIVRSNPNQRTFLRGWMNRLTSLKKQISLLG